jgi:hypothetical protein
MKHRSSSHAEVIDARSQGTSLLQPSRRLWLSNTAAWVAAASVGACGGGGGGDSNGGDGGGNGGGQGGPSGLILVQSNDDLQVFNATTNALTVYRSSASDKGIGASRAGVIGVVVNENARVSWDVLLLNAKTGAEIRRITIERPFAIANSAVAVNADATRIAFSVNEPNSASDNTRVDRTLVADVATLNATRIEGVTDPMFMGNELLVRRGDRLRVLNANLDDQGDLGVTTNDRLGGASPSSDGRYIAYERDAQLWVLDRQNSKTWQATEQIRSKFNPAFSPDGRHLAMLGGAGFVFGVALYVIPFVPNTTTAVPDEQNAKTAAGDPILGGGRIAWVNA